MHGGCILLDLLEVFGIPRGFIETRVRHPLVDLKQLLVLVSPPTELAPTVLQVVHGVPVIVKLVISVKHLKSES